MKKPIRAAVAQLAPVFLDRDATVEKACATIAEAGKQGADLVVFPETFVPGYPYWVLFHDPTETGSFQRRLFAQAVEVPSSTTEALGAAAREAGCFVAIGINERDGNTLYNTILYLDADGRIAGRHRKLVPTNHERMVWGRGDGRDLEVLDTPFGALGGLICYEHSNALFRYAVQAKHEALHVAVWPGGMPSITGIIDACMRSYAFEGSCFVLNATSVMTEEIIEALGQGGSTHKLRPGGGYSAIVAPRGVVLAGPAEGSEETLLIADLDPDLVTDAKMVVDCAGHYARPDVVRLQLRQGGHDVLEPLDD